MGVTESVLVDHLKVSIVCYALLSTVLREPQSTLSKENRPNTASKKFSLLTEKKSNL